MSEFLLYAEYAKTQRNSGRNFQLFVLSFKVSNVRKERNFSKIWMSTVFDANISQTKKSENQNARKMREKCEKGDVKKMSEKLLQQFT